jgi:hypothetical protein
VLTDEIGKNFITFMNAAIVWQGRHHICEHDGLFTVMLDSLSISAHSDVWNAPRDHVDMAVVAVFGLWTNGGHQASQFSHICGHEHCIRILKK